MISSQPTLIVGAGFGGLATALLLARRGERCVVFERDAAQPPATADGLWFDWPRPSTPQSRFGYGFLPGLCRDLAAAFPDVLERALVLARSATARRRIRRGRS